MRADREHRKPPVVRPALLELVEDLGRVDLGVYFGGVERGRCVAAVGPGEFEDVAADRVEDCGTGGTGGAIAAWCPPVPEPTTTRTMPAARSATHAIVTGRRTRPTRTQASAAARPGRSDATQPRRPALIARRSR